MYSMRAVLSLTAPCLAFLTVAFGCGQVEEISELDSREQTLAASVIGCADGQREGFTNDSAYPNIAGCSGGWTIPGVSLFAPAEAPSCPGLQPQDTRNPACGNAAGDDSSNPSGTGCNVADLCAPGWHVCLDVNDVTHSSPNGCTGVTDSNSPLLLFLSRQSSTGCGACANGTSTAPECHSATCAIGCLQTERVSNDVFGCGNYGSFSNSTACGTLDRFSGNMCGTIGGQGWSCDDPGTADNSGLCETFTIVHSNPSTGGVMCCRDGFSSDSDGDGVLDEDDNCISIPNADQTDSDADGYGDACDSCSDTDHDGVCTPQDNCPTVPNPGQADTNGNGVGDACEAHGPLSANAGPDQTLQCLVSGQTVSVQLNGTGSSAPNGDPLTYTWAEGGSFLAEGSTPSVTLGIAAHVITLTVNDGNGGSASDSVTIDVQADTQPPSITCPAERIVDATGPEGAFVTPEAATVSDACGATVSGPVAGIYPLGTTVVTYTATDVAGHSTSCTTAIHVRDSVGIPPNLTMCNMPRYTSAAQVKACGWATPGEGGLPIATVLLTVDGGVPMSLTPDLSGGFVITWLELDEGHHTVTLTAIDTAGVAASQSMLVTVDRTGPIVRVIAPSPEETQPSMMVDVVSEVTDISPVNVTANWVSTTSVDAGTQTATNTVTFSDSGLHVVLLRAMDAAGNISEQVIQVSIQ